MPTCSTCTCTCMPQIYAHVHDKYYEKVLYNLLYSEHVALHYDNYCKSEEERVGRRDREKEKRVEREEEGRGGRERV